MTAEKRAENEAVRTCIHGVPKTVVCSMCPDEVAKSGQTNYCLQCEQAGKKIDALEKQLRDGLNETWSDEQSVDWRAKVVVQFPHLAEPRVEK